MKKQNIINLVGYHMEENHAAFVSEVREIAGDFKKQGDSEIAEYLMDLISNPGVCIPMRAYKNYLFLEQLPYSFSSLYLPECIKEDVMGIIQKIRRQTGESRFLFYGKPGTGKTETVLQIGRLLKRDILQIRSKELSSPENIRNLFIEINHLRYDDVLLLFDDLDSWILKDSLTDPAVKELQTLTDKIPLIATASRFDLFGPSLRECFDSSVSFDRYAGKTCRRLWTDCRRRIPYWK